MIKEIGPVMARYLVSYCGSAEAVLKASKKSLLAIPSIGEKRANVILKANVFDQVEKQIAFCEDNDIRIHTYLDKDYPQRLLNFEKAPLVLYVKGNADLNFQRTIGMVGTRKMTDRGRHFCNKFVEEAQHLNPQIISGLAHGVDTASHKACVQNGISTIGVVGHGHDMIYPAINTKLAKEMENLGAVVSEFPIGTIPGKDKFPARNRIIAMMSDAIIVVESGERGGSMITAEFGNEYNKDVFAVPGRISDTYSRGCNALIKQNKAHLIESVNDLIYIMRWEEKNKKPIQKALFVELNEDEKKIVEHLKKGGATIDDLSYHLSIRPSTLASLLLSMEFKGVIQVHPGKKYDLA